MRKAKVFTLFILASITLMDFAQAQVQHSFIVEAGYGAANVYKGDFKVTWISENFEMQSAYYLQVGYDYRPVPQWVFSVGLAGYQDNFQAVYRHIIGYPDRSRIDEERVTYVALPLSVGYMLVEEGITLYTGWQPQWKVAQTGIWIDPDQSWNPSWLMGIKANLWSGLSLNARAQMGTTNMVNPANIEYWDPMAVERSFLYTYRGHVGVSWSF